MTRVEIAPLPLGALAEAGVVFGRAFADYPFIAELFGGERRRRAVVARAIYRSITRDCLAHGVVHSARDADGRLLGIASWLAPGAFPPSVGRQLRMADVARSVLLHYPHRAARALHAQVVLDRHHPVQPPHWYLAAIAVDPTAQGTGVGGRLMDAVLRDADAAGQPAFLETASADNARWYRGYGFAPQTVAPAFRNGPTQWWMWRDPIARDLAEAG